MAIYHCSAKIVSRGKGQSVLAKAAYNARAPLHDERLGQTHDYTKQGGLVFEGIFAPANAPEWMKDRQQLWQGVEAKESRRDAQLAREIEVSLPHELTNQQREWLVKDYVREAFVRKGMVADVCIHAPGGKGDERNHHAHILLTMRELGPDGFGPKVREWNSDAQLKQWRQQWEHLANRHLERHGHQERIDARSLKEQGLDREPTIHLGPRIAATEAKGRTSERGERQKGIESRNGERERLHHELREVGQDLAKALEQVIAEEIRTRAEATAKKEQEAADQARAKAAQERETARRSANDNKRSSPSSSSTTQTLTQAAHGLGRTAETGLRVTSNVAGRAADRLVDVVDGLLDVFVGAAPRKSSVADFLNNRETRRQHYQQMGEARKRDEALERMADDIRSGRLLSPGDVRNLTHHDLIGIKEHGDDYLKRLIKERERELSQGWGGRERERER